MFVEIVTAPYLPACAIIEASFSWNFAFNTWCGIPSLFNILLIFSEFSIEIVPTNTGWPFSWLFLISSTIALNLAFSFLYITSFKSFLIIGLFVGIVITSNLYISWNSASSVIAVPVIPESFEYILK